MRFWGLYNRNLRQLDLFKVFSFLLVLTNLFLAITVINTSKNSKIIITPPYITSEFENVGNAFSYSYYEQIGFHLSSALLTISPSNVNKTFDSIQGYFSSDPMEAKAIKDFLVKEAEQIKKDNIYQAFYPLKLLENHQNNSFTVEGLLKTMTGNIAMEEKKARINFNYRVNNKKLVIKSFEVIK
ncbi:TraE/TraK family type IV conjugative transfer system protein [Aliarcobacter lanthieri]|uniref:TraE/TraK family type IV conjugative transfer system protein n=1 Tax=Aliarcobacter lanthieri TaxID=1355374 RepID=UPI00047A1108|nr:TraE/TraK family type IV conjugative transfer system protein [Aliarcobacter lanthieri]QKF59208.1 F-type type IV conjugative transfer system protein TraE [Aliarcobacter lanthieri]